jgi:hypothetical protein
MMVVAVLAFTLGCPSFFLAPLVLGYGLALSYLICARLLP